MGVGTLVTRNYMAAVLLITPLALTLGEIATGATGRVLVVDRGLDTLLAGACAVATLLLVGRGLAVPRVRHYGRRILLGIEEVLVDLAVGRSATPHGLEHRRSLHSALLASHEAVRRATADEPATAGPYAPVERKLNNLGFLLLALAWRPDAEGNAVLARAVRQPIDSILSHPIWDDRPADELLADVVVLEDLVKAWRG